MSKVVEIDNSNAPLLKANKEITLAITGASGALYALNLLRQLVISYDRVHLLLSDAARVVLATESDLNVPKSPTRCAAFFSEYCGVADGIIVVSSQDNWFSPVASGSAAPKQMVICPASMGCVSAIATGASNNLMERAADVVLKERGQLILVPRESPFSSIHLRNLLTLSEAGAVIVPAAPGFYHKPENIEQLADFMSARVLNLLGVENKLGHGWGYKN